MPLLYYFFIIFLFFFSFLTGKFLNEETLLFSFSFLISLMIVIAFLILKRIDRNKLIKENKRMEMIFSFISTLSNLDEIIILTEQNEVIFSNEMLYENYESFSFKNYFLKKFNIEKIFKDEKFNKFFETFDASEFLEEIFEINEKNGTNNKKLIFLLRILPFSLFGDDSKKYKAIIIMELSSHYLANLNAESELKVIENYIENAPFGLIYLSSRGHILGANKKISETFSLQKTNLVGKHFSKIQNIKSFDVEKLLKKNAPFCLSVIKSFQIHEDKKTKNIEEEKIEIIMIPQKNEKDCFTLTVYDINEIQKIFNLTSKNLNAEIIRHAKIPSIIINNKFKIITENLEFTKKISSLHKNEDNDFLKFFNEDFSEKLKNKFISLNNGINQKNEIEIKINDAHKKSDDSYHLFINKINEENFLLQFINVSIQKNLESQLFHSQKMKSVGELTNGIAHDFNNLLTAILGFSDLLLQRILPNDSLYPDVMQIKQNSNRAANLIKQILTFSKKQSFEPIETDINEIINELAALLRRLIGTRIELSLSLERSLNVVMIDPVQFEQIIINLSINAAEAIEGNGTLRISTKNHIQKKSEEIREEILEPGEYILITVSDSGSGIKNEDLNSIFDPFFSTKNYSKINETELNKTGGTGIGLSTVLGIVKKHNGFIDVKSKMVEGTVFKIYFPAIKKKLKNEKKLKEITNHDLTGNETILFVDDEDAIRIFITRGLRERGYKIIEASNGEIALELFKKNKIDIVITDVGMPIMDGKKLFEEIRKINANIPVVLISGYSDESFKKEFSENNNLYFVLKPFTMKEVIIKIREVLNKKS